MTALPTTDVLTAPAPRRRPRDRGEINARIAADLAPLATPPGGPLDPAAALSAALTVLDASAELLARTAPATLANAPGAGLLATLDPAAPGTTDAVIAATLAARLTEVLACAAVRLPLPGFLALLPTLRTCLREAIEARLVDDRPLDPRQVIGLTRGLTQAIADGQADTAHQAVWVLREILSARPPAAVTPTRRRPRRSPQH